MSHVLNRCQDAPRLVSMPKFTHLRSNLKRLPPISTAAQSHFRAQRAKRASTVAAAIRRCGALAQLLKTTYMAKHLGDYAKDRKRHRR